MIFLYTRSGSPISRAIRFVERGRWSHVAMLYPYDNMVIEAVYPHVRKLVFKDWLRDKTIWDKKILQTTTAQESFMRSYAEAQVGKPYDIIGDLHFIMDKEYATQPDDKWFCSELGFETPYEAGIKLLADTRGQEVSPDLHYRFPLLV